jgi:hypothetical protein
VDPEFICDSKEEFFGDNNHNVSESPDAVDWIALGTPGSVPSCFVTPMLHCPDQFDGLMVEEMRDHSASEAEAAEEVHSYMPGLLMVIWGLA